MRFSFQPKSELIRTHEMCSLKYSPRSSTSELGSSESSVASWGSSTIINSSATCSSLQRRYNETHTTQIRTEENLSEKPPLPLKQRQKHSKNLYKKKIV